MPLTLDALGILDAIDRRGSFARAAGELERAPSSLTCAVRQIEAELDVLLFDRSGHRACFTLAGRLLLDEGRAPPGAGMKTRLLGSLQFVFCVAPGHALARLKRPLTAADLATHRAVVIADTARSRA